VPATHLTANLGEAGFSGDIRHRQKRVWIKGNFESDYGKMCSSHWHPRRQEAQDVEKSSGLTAPGIPVMVGRGGVH
jgi:hypothetical protein